MKFSYYLQFFRHNIATIQIAQQYDTLKKSALNLSNYPHFSHPCAFFTSFRPFIPQAEFYRGHFKETPQPCVFSALFDVPVF
jgi:hypothetical protein